MRAHGAARLPRRAIARRARARVARTWTDGDDELQVLSLWSLFEQRLHVGQRAALPAHVAGEVETMLLTAHGGRRRITTAFPIRVLAIEDVEYDE